MKRTHDEFYLEENNVNIKESFVKVADAIGIDFIGSIADVGCAAGAFPGYLKGRFPKSEICGIEYLDVLLEKAKNDFPEINFYKGDVLKETSVVKRFDVITMLGTLCIFDDYAMVLGNVLSWLRPKGRLILHNMISDYDIDVVVRYKPSGATVCEHDWESGWNILSKSSLELTCINNRAKLVSCVPFELNIDLEKKNQDVMRSWTEQGYQGTREIYNALHIRQPQQIAVIEKDS